MQLLSESNMILCEAKTVTEGQEKQCYIEGIMIQAEKVNRNGRIYPIEVIRKEVSQYDKEFIKTSRAVGEMNHPESPVVNMDRVSHLVKSLWFEGNNVIGKAKILKSLPMGNLAFNLIQEGVRFGVSTRGVGTVTETNRGNVVGDNFKLVAIDIVHDPSAPDAFMTALHEGKSWAIQSCQLAKNVFERNPKTRNLILEANEVAEIVAEVLKEESNQLVRKHKFDPAMRARKLAQIVESVFQSKVSK